MMQSLLQEQLMLLRKPSSHLDELARSPLFRPAPRSFTLEESTRLTYKRAKAFCNAYGLTVEDISQITPKFWKMHQEALVALDGGAFTLFTIQCNLFGGTLAPFAMKRPELQPVLQAALDFNISAQFMLTEVNHGLDARNIQTTATILPNGEIDLHTPTPDDAKVMPPTSPRGGLPVVAIVMARLIDGNQDFGIRPFLAQLGDGNEMCKGVTSQVLPQRTGCHLIDHSITSFNHVRLPKSSLLGSPAGSENYRDNFISTIHRVAVGTLFITAVAIPELKLAAFNATRFSQQRLVAGPGGMPIPVIKFRTQCLPILHTIAQYSVLEPFFVYAAMAFRDSSIDPRVRHGIATTFKAVALGHFEKSMKALNQNCGWQGHFEHNQILQMELETRGVSTAEGDIRVLAIRLASELLIGRYQLPHPQDPDSPIARHETGLFSEAKELLLKSAKGAHRSDNFNRDILPLALPLVTAIGHRMAFEAAVEANIDSKLIALYRSGVIKEDSAWYVEKGGLSRAIQREMETQAADDLLPQLDEIITTSGMQDYSKAPMTSKALWDDFVDGLVVYTGDAPADLLPWSGPVSLKSRL